MICGRQVTLGIYTLVEGNTLTASTAFPALTLLDTLRQPLQEFPRMLTMVLVEGRVSLERLNAFMNEADIVEYVKRGPAVVADARCIDIRGAARARPRCRFAPQLIHFIPDSLTCSVPLFLKRQCERSLGATFRWAPGNKVWEVKGAARKLVVNL
jgi:hypothetical protein